MAFISSADISYLASASSALAFHPPARNRMHTALIDVLDGKPLTVD
jgi:hypothetical protein